MAPRLRPIRETQKEQPKNNSAVDGLFGEREPEEPKQEELKLDKEEPKEEVVVEKVEAGGPDEATVRLQKQIEELKKSEEIQRTYAERMAREREEALRLARENAARYEQIQKESQEQEEVAVGAALAAARAEADKAESDYVAALNAGDNAAAGEAQRRMARAESRATALESGKEEIEARKKATPVRTEERRQIVPGSDADIEAWGVPAAETAWVKSHRDWASDPNKRRQLAAASQFLTEIEKIPPGNPQFIPRLEKALGLAANEPQPEPEAEERPSIVSAPVSREVPSASGSRSRGSIRLTPEQKDAAKIAGITEVEYAKQLQKLAEEKNAGNYSERRYG